MLNAVESLREALKGFDSDRSKGIDTKQSRVSVQKAIIRLRRSHASMRHQQLKEQSGAVQAAKRIQEAKLDLSNSRFLEAQCAFLAEKYNTAQFPELEKISSSLPSVEQYTAQHENDPGFVSYDMDQHQFMLNLLSSELDERHVLEEQISELQRYEAEAKKLLLRKKEFFETLASKLSDLHREVSGLSDFMEQAKS